MTIKIVKAEDPIRVDRLNLCIYGSPGIGKTSLAFTADRPLLLDFDNGAHRAGNRKDTVRVSAWEDVASISAADLADYSTVVVDTAGRALDILTADVIRSNPKAGRGGALTLQGYGTLKSAFIAWLKMINGFGKDVILVAHMDEQRNGDDIIERLDVQGGSKGEIYKAADAMGRVAIRNEKRMLNFNPTDTAFGKNPGQLDALVIAHPDKEPEFLADVIARIKARLNAMTEEQSEAQAILERWRADLGAIEDADGINACIGDAKNAGKSVSALLHDRATKLGLHYDKASGGYAAVEVSA